MIWKLAMHCKTPQEVLLIDGQLLHYPLAAGIPNVVYPAWGLFSVYHGICLTYSYKVPLLYLCVSMFGIINIIISSGPGGQGGFLTRWRPTLQGLCPRSTT